MNELFDNSLLIDLEVDATIYSFARLKELGIEQGFVTQDDILRFFPEASKNSDYLEQICVATYNEGILFIESANLKNSPREDFVEDGDSEADHNKTRTGEDNPLSNVDPDNLVGLYFCEAARSPLLTIEEEVDLAKRIERGFLARKEISDVKNKSAKRHEELLCFINDSWIAVEHLITANSRLVISIAKRYTNKGVPFLDLIQEGNIGLMRAAKRFDYKRGYKFSTYATWWIRQAITRALADQGRIIRVPVHIADQLSKMFQAQHHLRQELNREPVTQELAAAMNTTPEKTEKLIRIARHTLSLEMPTSHTSDSVLGDFIEDMDAPDPVDGATRSLMAKNVSEALGYLPAREARVLQLRYGITGGRKHTLGEIGKKIGVTRERVRQIEAKALERLRQPSIKRKLSGTYFPIEK